MAKDEDRELRLLPVLRGMRVRFNVWRRKRSLRPPGGTFGTGAKDNDGSPRVTDETDSGG